MTRNMLFWGLLGLWATAMGLSVLGPLLTGPDDSGFGRGGDRVGLFWRFQAAGLGVGLALWVVGRGLAAGWRRWVSGLPMLVVVVQVLGAAGLILWARLAPYPDITPPPAQPAIQPAN